MCLAVPAPIDLHVRAIFAMPIIIIIIFIITLVATIVPLDIVIIVIISYMLLSESFPS